MTPSAPFDIHLERLDSLTADHVDMLSDAERARRCEIGPTIDRDRYTLAAALLRTVVGHICHCDPRIVDVDRSCRRCGRWHGPPRLVDTDLFASISHSGDVVAVALSTTGPVGIDIEEIVERDVARIKPLVCHPIEVAACRTLHDLYVCWTRKEAVLKALGYGLDIAPSEIAVTRADEPPRVRSIAGYAADGWTMTDIAGDGAYVGAVALHETFNLR